MRKASLSCCSLLPWLFSFVYQLMMLRVQMRRHKTARVAQLCMDWQLFQQPGKTFSTRAYKIHST